MNDDRIQRVRDIQGACYIPSWSRTTLDAWGSAFQPSQFLREVSYAAGLGLNALRIWTNVWGYENDPTAYRQNLTFVFDEAHKRGIGIHLNLFDSGGGGPETAADGEIPSLADVRASVEGDEFLQSLLAGKILTKGMQVFGMPQLVSVPERDGSIAVWDVSPVFREPWFVASPGYAHLGQEYWDRWDAYVDDLVTNFRDHPGLLIIDVMNEPFIVARWGVDVDPVRRFYTHAYELVRQLAPDIPVTIGAENLEVFRQYEADLPSLMDAVSIHPLTFNKADFRKRIKAAKAFANETGGRPVIASEWGAFPGAHDTEQLDLYRSHFPILNESGVAWELTHLISGYGQAALTAILHPNGTMRPAARFVRDALAPW